jgi:ubiquinone/menaquinone biosynthesis C-methylase UbiE
VIAYEGPNAEQVRYWNDVMGPQWAAVDGVLSAQLRPLGNRALEGLDVRPGERVLDIGCGGGETTAEIARRVGSGGRVVGVDISEPLAARARHNIEGFPHAEIRVTDAQTTAFEPESFDALFSRFGVMFFSDPEAAFSNLRRALRPGGRMAFVCWRVLVENLWMTLPAMAVAKHLPVKRPEPNTPGPFAFADSDRVRGILERAGFVQVKHETIDEALHIASGESLDGAVSLLMRLGPAGAALREAHAGPELIETVQTSIREAIASFDTPTGVRIPSASWLVTAQRGD